MRSRKTFHLNEKVGQKCCYLSADKQMLLYCTRHKKVSRLWNTDDTDWTDFKRIFK